MNQVIKSINASISNFIQEEEGSQVVEYALIIAVVSIGLATALGAAGANGLQGSFTALVARVSACFTGGATC